MIEDWRITNQFEYLYKVKLRHIAYQQSSENWEHEHCCFCFDKFSLTIHNALKVGYCTLDQYFWICENCFNDFKSEFEWEIIS